MKQVHYDPLLWVFTLLAGHFMIHLRSCVKSGRFCVLFLNCIDQLNYSSGDLVFSLCQSADACASVSTVC